MMTRFQFGVVVALLGVLIGVNVVPLLVGTKTSPSEQPRYEYRIEGFKDAVVSQGLATAGAQGWDLAFARRAVDSGEGMYEVILKRPASAASDRAGTKSAVDRGAGGPPVNPVMLQEETPTKNGAPEVMAKMGAFRDEMCACKEADCAKKVSEDMTVWADEQAKNQKGPVRMSQSDQTKATEIGTAMGECMQRAMTPK